MGLCKKFQSQLDKLHLMLASELFAMRNAPLGVAGVGDFGVVNIQQNREITRLIAPFRKGTVLGVSVMATLGAD